MGCPVDAPTKGSGKSALAAGLCKPLERHHLPGKQELTVVCFFLKKPNKPANQSQQHIQVLSPRLEQKRPRGTGEEEMEPQRGLAGT